MKRIKTVLLGLPLFLFAALQAAVGQDLSQFKALRDSTYRASAEYVNGNKYQKDAMLFMDMVADTHPYLVKPERRAEWFAKKPALLEHCKALGSDEAFVDALIEVLGPLHDKHTDLTTVKRLQESRQPKAADHRQTAETGAIDREHIMRPHASYYDYQLFPEKSICYLQFNVCADAPDNPFGPFLDTMFAQMEAEGIRTLVVDAQYNGGGSSRLCDQLIQHLFPMRDLKNYTTYIRFSDLMALYNPRIAAVKAQWESDGHADELYLVPAPTIPADYQQPRIYGGKVVFVMGPKTFSSAGILLTIARDNRIGPVIGTKSTFSPSHYGEILPYRLPNTDVLGTISCKFFARPDAATVDDPCMSPDVEINLDDKDAAWQYIVDTYGR